jgi:hypothetical protein
MTDQVSVAVIKNNFGRYNMKGELLEEGLET